MKATRSLVGWRRAENGKRPMGWSLAFIYVKQEHLFICHSFQARWLRHVTGLCFGNPGGTTPEHKLVTLLPLSPEHTSTAKSESRLQSWGLTYIHHELTPGHHCEELPWQCQFSKRLPDRIPNHLCFILVPKLRPLPGFFLPEGLTFLIFFLFLQLPHNSTCEPVQLLTSGASCPFHHFGWSSKQLMHWELRKHTPTLWPIHSFFQVSQWQTFYSFLVCSSEVHQGSYWVLGLCSDQYARTAGSGWNL